MIVIVNNNTTATTIHVNDVGKIMLISWLLLVCPGLNLCMSCVACSVLRQHCLHRLYGHILLSRTDTGADSERAATSEGVG